MQLQTENITDRNTSILTKKTQQKTQPPQTKTNHFMLKRCGILGDLTHDVQQKVTWPSEKHDTVCVDGEDWDVLLLLFLSEIVNYEVPEIPPTGPLHV